MISFGGVTPGPLFRDSVPDPVRSSRLAFHFFLMEERNETKKVLKHKNSELRSSNSLCFFTPSVLHFLNLKSMRPESSESLQHRFARC